MENLLLVLSMIVLAVLSGMFDAVCDTLMHHFNISIFSGKSNWWNPKESWKYKYKLDDPKNGSRFPGSTTVLVFTTDAWHFFKFLRKTCVETAMMLPLTLVWPWWTVLVGVLVFKICYGAGFQPLYNNWLIKR